MLDFTSITRFFAKTIPSEPGEAAVIKRPIPSFIAVQTDNPVSS